MTDWGRGMRTMMEWTSIYQGGYQVMTDICGWKCPWNNWAGCAALKFLLNSP